MRGKVFQISSEFLFCHKFGLNDEIILFPCNLSFSPAYILGQYYFYTTKMFRAILLNVWWKIFLLFQADVSKAYDTIPHNKLVEVISRVLKPEKKTVYCIRRYAVIMITPSGRPKRLYRRHVWLPDFFLLL